MYKDKRILGLIPARAGSKGIPNKNIVDLCGKPLIAYTINSAIQSKYIDRVIVSTDGEYIAAIARIFGADVPFIRPKELASDSSKTIDVVLHTIKILPDYDVLVLLQPTQPLRTSEDIDGAVDAFFSNGEKGLASISLVNDHPLLIRKISETGELLRLIQMNSTCRRQDMPVYYRINGAIYINSYSDLNPDTSFNDNPVPYIMEKSHSIDIDERFDLMVAEYCIRNKHDPLC